MVEEISQDSDDKLLKLILEGHVFPCLHSDGFCKPALKKPYTIVWFPDDKRLKFLIPDIIGRWNKLKNFY